MSTRKRLGKTKGNSPPQGESWCWMTSTMLGSLTYRALGIHSRRVLDFLLYEHLSHGGMENGDLGASYRQLKAWGVGLADIRKGLDELIATGFVRRTFHGLRQAGGGEPSRFALTWLPVGLSTKEPQPPTHDWSTRLADARRDGVKDVATAKAWLKRQVAPSARGTATAKAAAKARQQKQTPTAHLKLVSLLK